jgi:hypothetical protein
MKRSDLMNLLSELVEAVCRAFGKLITSLIESFPILEKYFEAFLSGAEQVISKIMMENICTT